MTNVFLNELETVVDAGSHSCTVDIDNVQLRGVLLQRIALEVAYGGDV